MRLYVAAPLAQAPMAQAMALDLYRLARHVSVSTWHVDLPEHATDPQDVHVRQRILAANLQDLDMADAVVALMHTGTPRATIGEIAWALSEGKHVVWCSGPGGIGRNLWDAHRNVHPVLAERPEGLAGLVCTALEDVARGMRR
jgi:nucleoside 2-deoxyribosyltransferase